MGNIQVKISDDQQTAYLTIKAEADSYPDEETIEKAIRDAGVLFGVDRNLIRELVSTHKPVSNYQIARGRHRHDLEREQLVWYIELATQQKPRITIGGRADFKELKTVDLVRRNQEIVSMVPLPGNFMSKKVTGEEYRVEKSYLEQICGKNLSISDDGLTLSSQIDGCAFWKDGKLQVDNIYHINGDVGYRTGNIRFDGTILIEEDVRSGFRVNATGSVYINGSVEAAEIFSEKGDIIVKSGILGKGRARLVAGGSLHCRFIQDATVGVKKDVVIEHYAINTSISAGGSIYLIQNEGLLRGGKAFAEQGMRAVEVGSPQNIPTSIGLSGAEFSNIDLATLDLKQQEDVLQARLRKISKKVDFLRLLEQRLQKLSDEKQRDLTLAIFEVEKIESELQKIEQKKQQLYNKTMDLDQQNNIEVYNTLHRGVIITIGDQEYINETPLRNVRIYRRGNEIYIEKCGVENES